MGKNSKRNKRQRLALVRQRLQDEEGIDIIQNEPVLFLNNEELSIATEGDVAVRIKEQAEIYLMRRLQGELTREWQEWAKKHGELIETVSWEKALNFSSPERR
mgnify:CR=1 FL=1